MEMERRKRTARSIQRTNDITRDGILRRSGSETDRAGGIGRIQNAAKEGTKHKKTDDQQEETYIRQAEREHFDRAARYERGKGNG